MFMSIKKKYPKQYKKLFHQSLPVIKDFQMEGGHHLNQTLKESSKIRKDLVKHNKVKEEV